MYEDATDRKQALLVANYIGSDNQGVIISNEDVLAALEYVVALLGIFD